ncbi:Rgg/GadR/MutR family transcriptional regulator [Streptococcus pluranimalium]|uniref:helix-turn-helix domain-containing protein n=1 Tax=Streptococcus pluranimalium TaxID=82348 RepID=UPI0039FBC97D
MKETKGVDKRMNAMGELFKMLRVSRNVSLKEATGNEFSHSMLSRFENGESDMTITKLLVGLKNIRTDLDEFIYLYNDFKPSDYTILKENIWQVLSKKDLNKLNKMYLEEISKYTISQKEDHFFNALIIKGHMFILDESTQLTEKEQEKMYDYLFLVDIWGEYELKLFSDISPLISLNLYFEYTREMMKKIDFLGELRKNRNLVHSILLNGLFKSTYENNLTKAAYFNQMIQKRFFNDNDLYLRTVYMIANGHYLYCKGEKDLGINQIRDAIYVLKLLKCDEIADYYKRQFSDILVN